MYQPFINERARGEEEEEQHYTGACWHGNAGQLMRHQLRYKSFSMFAALVFPCSSQVASLSSACHTAALLEACENNRTIKGMELCRLSSVNEAAEALTPVEQQEEGWRQLVAIQGMGWQQSWAIPQPWEDSCWHCCMGRRQFPFSSAGVEPGC